jgi:hypothetical protein
MIPSMACRLAPDSDVAHSDDTGDPGLVSDRTEHCHRQGCPPALQTALLFRNDFRGWPMAFDLLAWSLVARTFGRERLVIGMRG